MDGQKDRQSNIDRRKYEKKTDRRKQADGQRNKTDGQTDKNNRRRGKADNRIEK